MAPDLVDDGPATTMLDVLRGIQNDIPLVVSVGGVANGGLVNSPLVGDVSVGNGDIASENDVGDVSDIGAIITDSMQNTVDDTLDDVSNGSDIGAILGD